MILFLKNTFYEVLASENGWIFCVKIDKNLEVVGSKCLLDPIQYLKQTFLDNFRDRLQNLH